MVSNTVILETEGQRPASVLNQPILIDKIVSFVEKGHLPCGQALKLTELPLRRS